MVMRASSEGPILVCEDDPMVLAFFADALQAAGYRVLAAPDGESALRLAARRRPAVILLDLALPRLDGPRVLSRLKANPRTAAIPVVVASAYPGWLTFLDRGQVAGVLEKPCLADELAGAVAGALTAQSSGSAGCGLAGRAGWTSAGPSAVAEETAAPTG